MGTCGDQLLSLMTLESTVLRFDIAILLGPVAVVLRPGRTTAAKVLGMCSVPMTSSFLIALATLKRRPAPVYHCS